MYVSKYPFAHGMLLTGVQYAIDHIKRDPDHVVEYLKDLLVRADAVLKEPQKKEAHDG